ncbi:hypothetical protein [Paraburkholderia sp. J12]|uniref:hypothetical protein n=1 Tax=Paraburkholderia sp. J12 TaxID=2805432 RepID=UPI002ABDDF9D|nr:hypothetical protein [Paraburkholderia sp. J12]
MSKVAAPVRHGIAVAFRERNYFLELLFVYFDNKCIKGNSARRGRNEPVRRIVSKLQWNRAEYPGKKILISASHCFLDGIRGVFYFARLVSIAASLLMWDISAGGK